jgi:hypothetical protein
MTVTVVAVATFLLLHGLCFALLTGQFKIPFPKVLDRVAAASLGFLAGFLIVALLTTLLAMTPLASLGRISDNDADVHQSYVCWWCDRIHGLVGSTVSAHPTKDTLDQLRKIEAREPSRRPAEPNTPARVSHGVLGDWDGSLGGMQSNPT